MSDRNPTVLSGGVGGARMVRALTLAGFRPATIVNVGDDAEVHGVHVSPDVDTVAYTLAGIEGPHGWGIEGDTWTLMGHLADLGQDTSFRLGDRDYAHCLVRTRQLAAGGSLSGSIAWLVDELGLEADLIPATDDRLRTVIETASGELLEFQEYFVTRGHRDEVRAVRYDGVETARPAPGVIEAIEGARTVVIAPSNPPLSIWPILALPGVRDAIGRHPRVVAVSPLFSGRALKGPAADVLSSLGLGEGTRAVLAAYEGLIDALVVDRTDAGDATLAPEGVDIVANDTDLTAPDAARRFAAWLMDRFS